MKKKRSKLRFLIYILIGVSIYYKFVKGIPFKQQWMIVKFVVMMMYWKIKNKLKNLIN